MGTLDETDPRVTQTLNEQVTPTNTRSTIRIAARIPSTLNKPNACSTPKIENKGNPQPKSLPKRLLKL